MNNFDRGPPRDHSCEVWSKSNKRFQSRCCLKKLLTDARTDDGRRTLKDHKSSLSTSCSGELKINNGYSNFCWLSRDTKFIETVNTNLCCSTYWLFNTEPKTKIIYYILRTRPNTGSAVHQGKGSRVV